MAAILARNSWLSTGVPNHTNQVCFIQVKKGPVAALVPVGSLERLCYTDWNLTLVKFY